MEISFSTPPPAPSSKPVTGTGTARPRESAATGAASTRSASSNVNLGAFEAVQQAMNHCPDSRADVVARGRALAADPNYPPAEVVGKLARLFLADSDSEESAD